MGPHTLGVAWTVPQFSKSEVNRAGAVLVIETEDDFEDFARFDRALTVLNNWRSSHSFP